jgi:8-oxo-dGTP pyrophosphatase MutT (NUDIX family)
MKYEKSCGAVVFRQIDGAWNTLLIRHIKGKHISFPKGHVEANETEKQTAEREILEETGLRVDADTRFRAQNRYMARPNVQKQVIFFVAVSGDGQVKPQPDEISEAEWYPIDEAEGRLTYERDRKILRAAYEYIIRSAE